MTLIRNLLLFFIGCLYVSVAAQSGLDSLYDDRPMQRFPLGISPPEYRTITADGGPIDKYRVEPPFWWTDRVSPELQLLIYDRDVSHFDEVFIDYEGISLVGVHKVENPNYLFLDLLISPDVLAGNFPIILSNGSEQHVYQYELRNSEPIDRGIDAGDLIYLIMPDRFANGDPQNDSFETMNQVGTNREKVLFRHGGDLIGIMEHLDYLETLGITTVWLNPVFENDQYYESYHGYAATDFYQVDKRLGTNEQYRHFVDLCHARGIQVVMDVVFNHVGDQHWFVRDLPSRDWINQHEGFTKTSYRAPVLMDPYAAQSDKERLTKGWVDNHMPDLNQENPLLANYLIQNSIWWAAFAGLDAFRIDTYFYANQEFMIRWASRMKAEFPDLSFFGETWVHGVVTQAQFTQNSFRRDINTNLPAVTDYQMHHALLEALEEEQGWTDGVSWIYYTLAKDFVYEDPYRNVLFHDNHDLTRIFSKVRGDLSRWKSAVALLMTTRGIPCIYFGTEILLRNIVDESGEAGRVDFPGGWPSDEKNKFLTEDRTLFEQQAFEYLSALARYRKQTTALQDGKLAQFVPEDGIYVYFRYDEAKTIMVIYNSNEVPTTIETVRFTEFLRTFSKAKDVISGQFYEDISSFDLSANATVVLELLK